MSPRIPEDDFTGTVEAAAAYERLRGMDDYDDLDGEG